MSSDVKQVKVDNWGIYFLQRLKHFFNRTDYCDLTLQFQDNAQLKVHRLVLSACTEYFELLERTCEMYEDCLVMPDDLQADIVVPIVNFMYTGQLEFRMELLDRLHQCSEIMNMPVLTKLLDSHRPRSKIGQSYSKRIPKHVEGVKETIQSISANEIVTTAPITYKRSHSKAFEKTTVYRDKKVYLPINKPALISNGGRPYREPSPIPLDQRFNKKVVLGDPRPTRYELPEELDTENIFENSFCNISYTSQPLMVHPETRKQYAKRPRMIGEASSSSGGASIVDIVDIKKPIKIQEDSLFEDAVPDDIDMFPEQFIKSEISRDPSQLFDQMFDKNEEPSNSKVTIETKNKSSANLDHAKIISEVLKKYPHLVKSNKNIKLKILNSPCKQIKKHNKASPPQRNEKPVKTETEADYTYETDVLNSKQAAKLIALGAENIEGPWICLICGTPGKAMNFTSYYKFRRHLVEVHNEKPVLNICEHCGQRSTKRNYLLHHMYTKHGVEPPAQYHFPKCTQCPYIALTEALLIKHKASSHSEAKNFRCNVCPSSYSSSSQLLQHIRSTGHKYSGERRTNLQCIYCQKVFMRESNFYAHLKAHHKKDAIKDGIVDDSDDDNPEEKKNIVKTEPTANDFEELDIQYQIQQRPDGNITVVTKKANEPSTSTKQKILNTGLSTQVHAQPHKSKVAKTLNAQTEFMPEITVPSVNHEDLVMIDNIEYIMRNNELIPRRTKATHISGDHRSGSGEYILSDHGLQPVTTSPSMEFTSMHNSNVQDNIQHANMLIKNPNNLNQPIPIYVSNEEEYKALVASNQSIIFDSGDANKTLTVLTAPHTSSLGTAAIDIDSTQSNDMMIIQDDYPLNVSETVAPENSNIVVVYSHQVGDENKQYQLLTTQGLGAQFVQSSAILTQNYETITTTVPGMNTQVLGKQGVHAWPHNIEQIVDTSQIEITPVSNLQSIVQHTNQVHIANTADSNTDISGLPEVEIPSNVTVNSNSNTVVVPVSSQDIAVEEVAPIEVINENNGDCVDDTQNICMEIAEEGPVEDSEEETADSTNPADISVENVEEPEKEVVLHNDAIEETEIIESQTFTQPVQDLQSLNENVEEDQPHAEKIIMGENVEEDQNQSEEMSMDENQATEMESIQHEFEEEPSGMVPSNTIPETTSDVPINTEQSGTEDVTETVQTLASEWSEEDTQDKQEDCLVETIPQDETDTINNGPQNENDEIEESIENIQQEVEKQMANSEAKQDRVVDEEADVASSLQEEAEQEENNPETVIVDPANQEKISSLLNDWEDNESQEDEDNSQEDNSVNENIPPESDDTVEKTLNDTAEIPAIENENPEQQEKIKSLVSDWDEDEEEVNKD